LAEKALGSVAIAPSEVPDRALILAEGTDHVWQLPVPNPNEPNSALTYCLYVGDANDARLRVTLALLAQLLSEPAFNILRTQEQLGYVVHCSQMVLARDARFGIRIVIMSERAPAYLEERVEAFLDGMKMKLDEMSAEEFEEQKRGLGRKWMEGLKNLREETNRFWKYIEAGHLDFDRRTFVAFPVVGYSTHLLYSDRCQGHGFARGCHKGRRTCTVHGEDPPYISDSR
jgi:insulysin